MVSSLIMLIKSFILILPVLDERVRHGALRDDCRGERVKLELRETRLGAVEEEGGEALEVVVGGGDGQRQRRHPAQQPEDVLGVGAVSAQQLEQKNPECF